LEQEMKMESLLAESNLIITTFETQHEAELVHEALQQLRREGQSDLDAIMFTRNENSDVQIKQIGESPEEPVMTPKKVQSLNKLINDKGLIGSVIASLAPGSSAMMVVVGDHESSAVMVTFIAIILAGSKVR
jgi:uncharacterized membrane protein